MNNIKNDFSIKDLENLSGIKAHTIRIWEKRYNVLEPMRSETNIRFYDIKSLQKLLSIVLLHNYGYKISKISKLNEPEIVGLVNYKLEGRTFITNYKTENQISGQLVGIQIYKENTNPKVYKIIFGQFL